MTVKRGGLGRNLSALLSSAQTNPLLTGNEEAPKQLHTTLDCERLQGGKYQPRSAFDDATLTELAESIKKQGLLQPLLVRPIDGNRFEIIAGERRWRACQLAEVKQVPVIIHHVDDETAMAMALVENLQREDLNAMDQARAMHRLTTEFALTHQQIAEILSKSRTAVTNFLRLLHLNAEVKLLLEHGDIDMGHARSLLILEEQQQSQVAQLIVAKNLSVRETESLVARVKAGKPLQSKPIKIPVSASLEKAIAQLSKQLHTKVKLKPSQQGKGTLVIHYNNTDNLQQILDQFMVDEPCL